MNLVPRTSRILSLVALAVASAVGAPAAMADTKIGFVDVDLAATRSKSVQASVKSAEDKLRARQEELDGLYRELRRMQDDLKARRSALSAAEVRKQETAIQDQRDKADALELEVNREVRRTEVEVMGPAVDRILLTVKEVGKKEGFDLILRSDVVLYGVEAVDITAKVIDALDRK